MDLSEPRAAAVMQSVRQRVATLADARLALRRAGEAAATTESLLRSGAMGSGLGLTGEGFAIVDRMPEGRPLWIVGDLRGDVIALTSALAFIDEADGSENAAAIAFLGDWTGGGGGDAACAALVLERFNASPDRTLLLRGDREWAGSIRSAAQAPGIRDMPHADELSREHGAVTAAIERIANLLPAIALLPDGVVLAHGSLPRPARLREVASIEALRAAEAALRDCTLGRMHLREMRVQPAEREGGVIVGVENFEESLARLRQITGRHADRLVRGQDAAPEGFRWFKAYGAGAVLTLTTMADALPEASGVGRRKPCLGRLKGGRMRVVRLDLPEDVAMLGDRLFSRRSEGPAAIGISAAPDGTRAPMAMPKLVQPATAGRDASELAASAWRGPEGARMQFDRGVRLLQSGAWAGAREAFRTASADDALHDAAALNEAVACMWLGSAGHQQALALLRLLRQTAPRDAVLNLNLGIVLLAGERNPSEAMRAFRAAAEANPDMADAWWALGLAAAMRSDSAGAAGAFARADECGCPLPAPGSLHGLIPERELATALEALRGLARHRPAVTAEPVPLMR